MKTRRFVALAAYALLVLVLLLAGGPRPTEVRRRVRLLAHDANRDLASRRLDGSSAAFDRRFFFFLESARRKLPPDGAGIAVFEPDPQMAAHVLALYQFAPRPVLLAPREEDIPPGWILAVYGNGRPEGWREIARVSDGALYARLP